LNSKHRPALRAAVVARMCGKERILNAKSSILLVFAGMSKDYMAITFVLNMDRSSFEAYEDEYVQRMEENAQAMREKTMTDEEIIAIKEAQEAKIKSLIENFDVWDFAVLEAIRRENLTISIKIGTMRYLTALEKLHYCKMIKWKSNLNIDEREKLQEFYDSALYKSYKDRLAKVTTWKEFADIEFRMKKLIPDKKYSMPYLTSLGLEHLRQQRKKAKDAWLKLKAMWDEKDMKTLTEQSTQNMAMMPLFLLFGFASGTLLHAMLFDAGIDAEIPFSEEIASINISPSYSGGDYGIDGAGDFDFGGFF